MKFLFPFVLIFVLYTAATAQNDYGNIADLKPQTRHILPPRTAEDLGGEWERTEVGYQRQKNEKTGKFEYTEVPLNPEKAKWETVILPRVEKYWTEKALYFRKKINIPERNGIQTILHFEKIIDRYDVSVNGEPVAEGLAFGLPVECNITKVLKPGENEILIRLRNEIDHRTWTDNMALVNWATVPYMGICRPFYLESRNEFHIKNLALETRVAPEKTITVKVRVRNDGNTERNGVLKATLENEWMQQSEAFQLAPKEEKELVFTQKWPNAKLWNPAEPALYHLDLELEENGKRTDAWRQRFGFREIKIIGNRITLNGHPFLNRRSTFVTNSPADKRIEKQIAVFKKHGVTGVRVFLPGDVLRYADSADELGFFVSPVCAAGGGAGGRSDIFWEKAFPAHLETLINACRNNPSIIFWNLANEFGHPYGGNPESTLREQKIGKLCEKLDPTRFWTYCGEIELGVPHGGPGPAPVRSFHYPLPVNAFWNQVPDCTYWYANGGNSWQGKFDRNKPLMLSEDLYHGMNDQYIGMVKWAGDSIFTPDGYLKAYFDIMRMFSEGWYYAGLSEWEPWCTSLENEGNPLGTRWGQPIPDYLIAFREYNPNFRSGEKVSRTLLVYNQYFTNVDGELLREEYLNGKKIASGTQKISLSPGAKHEEEITLHTPEVKTLSEYNVKYVLKQGDKNLFEKTFEFFIYPKFDSLHGLEGVALLASQESPLRRFSFPGGTFDNTEEALVSGHKAVVIHKDLTAKEGKKWIEFISGGGKVFLLNVRKDTWAPLELVFNRVQTYLWRRNDDLLPEIREKSLRSWLPAGLYGRMGNSSYLKTDDTDSIILLDAGNAEGMRYSVLQWLPAGKGAWMLCQIPLDERLDVEPAAGFVLQTVLNEFVKGYPQLTGKLSFAGKSKYKFLMDDASIPVAETANAPGDVLFLDLSGGATEQELKKMREYADKGGSVFIVEPSMKDKELLRELGLEFTPSDLRFLDRKISREERVRIGNLPSNVDFIARKHNSGIMAGIVNDDLFWRKADDMWCYFRYHLFGDDRFPVFPGNPVLTGMLTPGVDSKAEILTEPGGIAVAPYRKGRVIVTTLRWHTFFRIMPRKIVSVLRTLLVNTGVRTSDFTGGRRQYEFFRINENCNAGFYERPEEYWKKNEKNKTKVYAPGWFGDGDDMRYFPVNQCGWSPVANNYCPVDDFPFDPIRFSGYPFHILNPEKNNDRSVIILAPGREVTFHRVKLKKKPVKVCFLGASNEKAPNDKEDDLIDSQTAQSNSENIMDDMLDGSENENVAVLEMSVEDLKNKKTQYFRFIGGDHFNSYRFPGKTVNGKLAWNGPSQKTGNAALYLWNTELTGMNERLRITLKNTSRHQQIAVVAITVELEDGDTE